MKRRAESHTALASSERSTKRRTTRPDSESVTDGLPSSTRPSQFGHNTIAENIAKLIGYFEPEEVNNFGTTEPFKQVGVEVWYTNAYFFTSKVRDEQEVTDGKLVGIERAFRGRALTWWLREMLPADRTILRNASTDEFCRVIEKRFGGEVTSENSLDVLGYAQYEGASGIDMVQHFHKVITALQILYPEAEVPHPQAPVKFASLFDNKWRFLMNPTPMQSTSSYLRRVELVQNFIKAQYRREVRGEMAEAVGMDDEDFPKPTVEEIKDFMDNGTVAKKPQEPVPPPPWAAPYPWAAHHPWVASHAWSAPYPWAAPYPWPSSHVVPSRG